VFVLDEEEYEGGASGGLLPVLGDEECEGGTFKGKCACLGLLPVLDEEECEEGTFRGLALVLGEEVNIEGRAFEDRGRLVAKAGELSTESSVEDN